MEFIKAILFFFLVSLRKYMKNVCPISCNRIANATEKKNVFFLSHRKSKYEDPHSSEIYLVTKCFLTIIFQIRKECVGEHAISLVLALWARNMLAETFKTLFLAWITGDDLNINCPSSFDSLSIKRELIW